MVKTVGLRKETAEHLLMDAGAIYKNLQYENGSFDGEILGATSGGNEFEVEVEKRTPEIDGMRTRVKGMEFIETHNAQLVVNLKEVTAQNIKLAIGAADVDESDADFDVITGRTEIKASDYVDNIAFVGRLSGSNKPVVIVIDNALSAEGFTLSAEENNEAIIPITFHAHADADEIESGVPGYKIYRPKKLNGEG